MRRNKKLATTLMGIACLGCIAGGAVATAYKPTQQIVYAESVTDSTGVTLSKDGAADFSEVAWKSKTIVFDVKTDGTETQFQLRKHGSGGGGIIRTKPDRKDGSGVAIHTADAVSYETQSHVLDSSNSYWGSNCYSVSLGDGWYRWVIDLSDYKLNDSSDTVDHIKCLKGNDVQIKNLNFYDVYAEANQFGYLGTSFDNWSSQVIRFDVQIASGTQRRFQLCKQSGSGVSGLIRCTKDKIYVENKNYVSGDSNNPYWLPLGTPVSLGDSWYRYTVDLSKLAIATGRTGTETIDKIKNLPENNDGAPSISMNNFKVVYDPTKEEGVSVWSAGQRTAIPDVANWGSTVISFEVHHDSLRKNGEPQFLFGEKGTENNTSSFFGYKDNDGRLWLNNALWVEGGSEPYWVEASTQPEELENGWYRWTIDLSQLSEAGDSDRKVTLGNVLNRGSEDVYIKNFQIVSTYDPTQEEGVQTWVASPAGTQKIVNTIPDIPYWQYATISFDVYHDSLDQSVDPQFIFSKKGSTDTTSGFFGYKTIGSTTALWLRTSKPTGYWEQASTQPVSIGNGWYRWTIKLSELGVANGDGTETLGGIWNRGNNDVLIKNFVVTTSPFVMLDNKEINIPYSEGATIKLGASVVDATGTLKYTSSNESVATVDQRGVVSLKSYGTCDITVSVDGNDNVRSAVCKINSVELKEYVTLGVSDLTGESKLAFPVVNNVTDNIDCYSYTPVSSDNPSVVVRFLMDMSYLEQNRQAVTIWGAESNGLYDGTYGVWAVCWKGAYVFDMYGSNGDGGIFVNGAINVDALNNHNTRVQDLQVNTKYYVEAGAIDLKELINGEQLSYFYMKVNGVMVWSTIGKAEDKFRNPVIAFTASKASRCTISEVELVDVTMKLPTGDQVVQVANGLKLPELPEPVVTEQGKKFIGWQKANGELWNYDYDKVDGAMELTAVITSDYYTVEFDWNYDSLGLYETKYVGSNMATKAPIDDPARTGYRFKWWSTSVDGSEYDFDNAINSDVKLYAVWVKTYEVKFVYEGTTYLSTLYDVDSTVLDPDWGYSDNAKFGKWADRGMFALNKLANGRAPYYSLTEGGQKIDLAEDSVFVDGDITIYINFAEVETVKGADENYSSSSAWDYVSLRDLEDKSMAKDQYYFTKYDTSTSTYVPSKNNTTDSVIFRGKLVLGDKFSGVNVNIGSISLRSSLNANNSINIWLRTNEVYLRTKVNGDNVYLANAIFDSVRGISDYLDAKNFLKVNTDIPVEFGILAVVTPGFEDYDKVYFKIGDATVFDVIIPKMGKIFDDPSYRLGFYTDSDTASAAALSVKGVYDSYTVEFKDAEGNGVASSKTLDKYSLVTKPAYTLPTVAGKEFIGWYNAETKLLWDFAKDRITSDLVLVPTYGYTVTLNPNGGAFPDRTENVMFRPFSQKVAENGSIKFGTTPTRMNGDVPYDFVGWKKPDGTMWDPETDFVTENITLTAEWSLKIKVSFYIDDESNGWGTKVVGQGEVVGLPRFGIPTSEDAYGVDGFEFLGWFMYNESGDFVEVDLTTLVAGDTDMKIFAIFSDDEDDNGGSSKPTKKGGCKGNVGSDAILLSATMLTLAGAVMLKKKKD